MYNQSFKLHYYRSTATGINTGWLRKQLFSPLTLLFGTGQGNESIVFQILQLIIQVKEYVEFLELDQSNQAKNNALLSYLWMSCSFISLAYTMCWRSGTLIYCNKMHKGK